MEVEEVARPKHRGFGEIVAPRERRVEGAEIGVYRQTLRFANYTDTLSEYATVFGRSFFYALLATVFALAISYPLAYAIAFKVGRWRNVLLVLVVAPFFVSFLLRTIAWKQILADEAWVADALRFLQRSESEYEANWKICVENFSECYHCDPVHPMLMQEFIDQQSHGAAIVDLLKEIAVEFLNHLKASFIAP